MSKYICSCCGKEIDSWPALAYKRPAPYDNLSHEKQKEIGKIGSDFCQIEYPERTDYFIRCVMIQKVNDSCNDLEYGLWVSLSEKSFTDYWNNFDNEDHEAQYFGWLCNTPFPYSFEQGIPVDVVVSTGNQRPFIFPQKSNQNELSIDFHRGISLKNAIQRLKKLDYNAKEEKWWMKWIP